MYLPKPCGQPNGNPMTYFYVAKIMRKERIRLGLKAYDLRALRYRSVKELAWANCTDEEIVAYSGHATTAMIAKYAGEAWQEMRARTPGRSGNEQNRNLIPQVIPLGRLSWLRH